MKREDVHKALDTERAYQDEMTQSDGRPDMIEDMHIGDILSAIQFNVDCARASWYSGSVPHKAATNYLRKVAALCVKAGEIYGMENR